MSKRPLSPRVLTILLGVAMVSIAALAYLPGIDERGYYRDDWYYIVDRLKGGSHTFQTMFFIDRPARGPFFEAAWRVFGANPLPWHLASWLARLAGGAAAWWLFHLLFPQRKWLAWSSALLYLLYPGYRSWVSGVEFLPMAVSAALHPLSLAFTVYSLRCATPMRKLAVLTAAALSGWAALALVDYAIGLELLRLLCLALLLSRPLVRRRHLSDWMAALAIPALYLFWRVFLFQGQRAETNPADLAARYLQAPLETLRWWVVTTLESLLNQLVFAWGVPLHMSAFSLSLTQILACVLLALLSLPVAWVGLRLLQRAECADQTPDSQPLWLGLAGTAAALVPIILANRMVEFIHYAHYSLPAALPAALTTAALLGHLRSRRLVNAALLLLIFLSVWSQTANERGAREEQQRIAALWHQVLWRAPDLREGTLLLVQYPGVDYLEDIDAAQGPANYLYRPYDDGVLPVWYSYSALPFKDNAAAFLAAQRSMGAGYRTHHTTSNVDLLLVISQPTTASCAHLQDGRWPRLSASDAALTRYAVPYSRISTILTTGSAPQADPLVFGPPPERGWCWYYQQAELAVQREDWPTVRELGREAETTGLSPGELVEWMPFIQAEAVLGDAQALARLAERLRDDPSAQDALCPTLQAMRQAGYGVLDTPFCQPQ